MNPHPKIQKAMLVAEGKTIENFSVTGAATGTVFLSPPGPLVFTRLRARPFPSSEISLSLYSSLGSQNCPPAWPGLHH